MDYEKMLKRHGPYCGRRASWTIFSESAQLLVLYETRQQNKNNEFDIANQTLATFLKKNSKNLNNTCSMEETIGRN